MFQTSLHCGSLTHSAKLNFVSEKKNITKYIHLFQCLVIPYKLK